jgi:hypothetical protein
LIIVNARICPLNFDWDDFSKVEGKCMQQNAQATYLLTKALSSSAEDMIIKEYRFLEDAHLLWNVVKEMFSKTTVARDPVDGDYLTKLIRPVRQTSQVKTATSKL